MREDNYPEPVSDPEAEGLPGTADDDSTAYDDVESGRAADGPDPAQLPADTPLAVDRFGVTAEEQRHGESLDQRLAQEEPDVLAEPAPTPPAAADVNPGNEELDLPGPDAGLVDEPPIEPDKSPVSLYDRPDVTPDAGQPVGRLVEPDEGARTDEEKDAVAWDAGAAGGGPSAEELAMHEVREP